ncbi:LolA family protein [Halorhabdus salina]|uniref:LolA family protein n=1 Tax=Halorhabdus salina TaxID=2750670 RepID=UPI0015EF7759|nr:outer membrane lipoprotein carrier protein LolA [Halorhabdus salina]
MRNAVALIALALLAALAGCSDVQLSGPDVPSGAEAERGYDTLKTVEGVFEYRLDDGDRTSNTTVNYLSRPVDGMVRQRVLPPSNQSRDITVNNGSVAWIYDVSADSVTRIEIGNLNISETGNQEFVRRVFGNVSRTNDGSLVSDSLLPVGPLGGSSGGTGLTTADLVGQIRFNVTYLGTRTVADRRTHGVELDPVGGNATDGLGQYIENATYWFDAEYFYPLRTETVININGDVTRSVQVYRTVSFNVDPDPERFRFDPPPDVTVQTPSMSRTTTFETVAAADANVTFDIPNPTLPGKFEFDEARISRNGNRTVVSLQYANSTHEVSVVTRDGPTDVALDGESVSLKGVNATMTMAGEDTIFAWSCSGLDYVVQGNFSTDTLRSIAADVVARCSCDESN